MPRPAPQNEPRPIDRLIAVMERLRDPEDGCPWDVKQTFASIAPYTIEEAYEVADAIERGDLSDLKEELGDLLLQVIFHARIAQERGDFSFDDVAGAIADKLERRHPHVFGQMRYASAEAQTEGWEEIKAAERVKKGRGAGVLDDVPAGLPAMSRAVKLTARAARVGFDWPDVDYVFDKLHEELDELKVEMASGDRALIREELGDVLFVCANLARWLKVEPEDALRAANAKFVRRFRHVEARLAERGKTPEQSDLAEMDAYWNEVRASDKG